MKRTKRVLVGILVFLILIIGAFPSMSVLAAQNVYPSSQTISGITTVPCTYYAWQQSYDRLGIALPNWGNAINWLNKAAIAGYSTGSVAQVNSIAVWRSSVHSYGHVSFVTDVNGNSMTINEGGMTVNNKPANGTGIITGAKASSVVGTKKDSYSSCTLLGFIYLTEAPKVVISYSLNSETTERFNNNIVVGYNFNKSSSVSVSEIGIKVRQEGKTYSEGWSYSQAPTYGDYKGKMTIPITWNFKDEVKFTPLHATTYYYQLYTKADGASYWSAEYSISTTGSHSYGSWTTTKAATCTSAGSKKRTCSCGKYETETIAAKGHYYEEEFTVDTKANCGKNGSKSKHCRNCDAKTKITVVPATNNHSYKNDCDTTCNVCGYTRSVSGHIYKNNCDPTCDSCDYRRSINHK